MPSDKKPVYIPRQKRLHGAFRGGFSAGYFNTVGSREGWTPRQQQGDDDENVQQRPEDFMDEQDHNEWGGPSAVNAAFHIGGDTKEPTLALLTGAVVPPANMGRQLLRALGWRESSSSAFVPSKNSLDSDHHHQEEQLYLSARRLRKIRLSQVKVEIPQPKLDTAGLGFERFANAPEFQRDREKRRKLQANHQRKVYRVADAVGGASNEPLARAKQKDDDDHYVSFETENDFVGSKSVGGFALHEDEDDAYDEDGDDLNKVTGKVNIDQENYDSVAYEHPYSSDEEHQKESSSDRKYQGSKGVAAVLGSVLSAWASASAPEGGEKKQVLTSDGRPVLSGFVLGGTDSSFASSQRYPGPNVPEGYEVDPHAFSVEDHPRVIQALSHAEKLAASAEQKTAIVENALKLNAAVNNPTRLHQKGIFEAVRTNMSSRFVSSSSTVDEQSNVLVTGLSTAAEYEALQPQNDPTKATENPTENSTKKLTITRTASMFVPEPLLCKRFHVSPPEVFTPAVQPTTSRTREEAYFQDEILAKVKVAPPSSETGEGRSVDGLDDSVRPSMEVYKSIYNVQDSPESTEDEQDGDTDEEAHVTMHSNELGRALDETASPRQEQIVPYEGRKRSRSPSNSSDDDSLPDGNEKRKRRGKDKKSKKKERRRDDDRKRKKKHKKSSKRKRDRDGHDD